MTDSASDKPTDTTDSLSVTEAAARLGVSERTIWRRIKQGKLDTQKTTDGIRVSLSDIPATVSDSTPVSDSSMTDNVSDSVSVAPASELIRALDLVSDLTRRNEQLAGQVGFLQAKVQEQEKQIALLMAPKDELPEPEQPTVTDPEPRPWWKRLFG